MSVEKSIREGYRFNLSQYLAEGFELYKKDMGSFVGYGLLIIAIVVLSKFMPVIGYVIGLVLTPLYAGYYVVADRIRSRKPYVFTDFFGGFERAFDLIIASIAKIFILSLIIAPFIAFIGYNAFQEITAKYVLPLNPTQFFEIIKILVPTLTVFGVLTVLLIPFILWVDPIIVFSKSTKPIDALKQSYRLTMKNYFPILSFTLAIGFINFLGAFFFGVFLLLTIPLTYCIVYAAFNDISEMFGEETIAEIL